MVDEDPDARVFLSASPETHGFDLTLTEDGERMLTAPDAFAHDLVPVDFAMPSTNCAQMAGSALQRHPDMPIILANGYSDTAAIERAFEKSAISLRKLFKVPDLGAVPQAALETRRHLDRQRSSNGWTTRSRHADRKGIELPEAREKSVSMDLDDSPRRLKW